MIQNKTDTMDSQKTSKNAQVKIIVLNNDIIMNEIEINIKDNKKNAKLDKILCLLGSIENRLKMLEDYIYETESSESEEDEMFMCDD
jgi:hypothetical protein